MHVPPHDGLNDITNWRGIIPQWRHDGGELENELGNWSDFHGNGGKRTKRTSEEEKKKKIRQLRHFRGASLRLGLLFRLDLT